MHAPRGPATRPGRPAAAAAEPAGPEHELLFCAVCQVSIASAELVRGEAMRTPRGRVFCGACAVATPQERARRRAELEIEFADDAPVPVVSDVPEIAPPPLPPTSPEVERKVLDLRVGELERSVFRLQARIASLEEKLGAVLAEPE